MESFTLHDSVVVLMRDVLLKICEIILHVLRKLTNCKRCSEHAGKAHLQVRGSHGDDVEDDSRERDVETIHFAVQIRSSRNKLN